MLFSHRFGSVETLTRARNWLTHHGFEVVKADASSHDVARLTLNVDFTQASAALALIDSIESADPDGWPSNSTPLRSSQAHAPDGETCSNGHRDRRSCTPICWHPREEAALMDANHAKVADYMFSRWE